MTSRRTGESPTGYGRACVPRPSPPSVNRQARGPSFVSTLMVATVSLPSRTARRAFRLEARRHADLPTCCFGSGTFASGAGDRWRCAWRQEVLRAVSRLPSSAPSRDRRGPDRGDDARRTPLGRKNAKNQGIDLVYLISDLPDPTCMHANGEIKRGYPPVPSARGALVGATPHLVTGIM